MGILDKAKTEKNKRIKQKKDEAQKHKKKEKKRVVALRKLANEIAAVFMTVESEGRDFSSEVIGNESFLKRFDKIIIKARPRWITKAYNDNDYGRTEWDALVVEYQTGKELERYRRSYDQNPSLLYSHCDPEDFENMLISILSEII